jgi:hypothetical protein
MYEGNPVRGFVSLSGSGSLPVENWITRAPLPEVDRWTLLSPEATRAASLRIAAQLRARGSAADIAPLPDTPKGVAELLRAETQEGWGIHLTADICWVEEGAPTRLLRFQKENPEFLFTLPAVANTVASLFMWQIMGCIPVLKIPKWESDQYCHPTALTEEPLSTGVLVHEIFQQSARAKTLERWNFNRLIATKNTPVAPEAFAWHGPTWNRVAPNTRAVEAASSNLGELLSRAALAAEMPCVLHGEARMALFANDYQREHFAATDILKRYRELVRA